MISILHGVSVGTMVADLSSPAKFLAVDRRPLPPVTLVFAAVESGKQLMRKKDQQAVMVHNILIRVMQVGGMTTTVQDCADQPTYRSASDAEMPVYTACMHTLLCMAATLINQLKWWKPQNQ